MTLFCWLLATKKNFFYECSRRLFFLLCARVFDVGVLVCSTSALLQSHHIMVSHIFSMCLLLFFSVCVCVRRRRGGESWFSNFLKTTSLVLSPPRLQQNVVRPLPVPHYHRHRRLPLRQRSLGVIHHPHRAHRVRRISLLSPTSMETRTKGRLLTVMSRADASRGRHLVAPNGL